MKTDIPLVHKSLKLLDQITADRRDVTFIWVPSHVGIEGNEAADREAKRALNHAVSGTQIPYSDLRQSIASATYREWQNRWEAETHSKLRQIVADVRWRPTSKGLTRRGSTTISRLRIGHTYITHSFVLKKEEPPLCEYCDSRLTVEHILVDCPRYQDVRAKYFRVTNLNTLFDKVDPGKVAEEPIYKSVSGGRNFYISEYKRTPITWSRLSPPEAASSYLASFPSSLPLYLKSAQHWPGYDYLNQSLQFEFTLPDGESSARRPDQPTAPR
ncbi:pol protein [Biomphalaria glabrata]|nr:pol protein [Biomphalaria glabrata]